MKLKTEIKSRNKQSSVKSWDEIWNSYDRKSYECQLALEENSVRWQKIQETIIEKYGSFKGLNCIEIGAGSGHYSMLFARRGAKVTLLDYSKKALEFCQAVFKDNSISENQARFIHMDALRIDPAFFNTYDVSMSFGVAEHFRGSNRKEIVKTHYNLLKKDGITFISVPHANCIPFRIYHLIMKIKKRDVIECYPYTIKAFRELASDYNIGNYFFIGSSFIETYNPFSFYKRKKNLFRETSKIKKEKPRRLDKYLGREITFIAQKD